MKKMFTLIALVLCLSLLFGCTAKKETEFPEGPITVVVNYGGGGSTDLSTRALAKAAEKHLGVPITVVNKSGGSGTTGIIEVQKSKADGYTIGILTYSPLAIVPHQMEVPYKPTDFKYIMGFGEYRYGVAVKNDSKYKSIEDLVKAAKEKPDGLAYSASGFPQPMAMNAIGDKHNVKFNYVPFKSGSEAVTAVLGGHVEVTSVIMADLLPFLKSGEMRLLASSSSERWEQVPDVQTLKELGYDVAIASYMGMGAPKDVPEDRLNIIREAFIKAFNDQDFQDVMKKINVPAVYKSGDEYEKLVVEGYDEMKKLMTEMGLTN